MDWLTFIRISHIIGTVLGVGATTFAEIFYLKFLKDEKIDPFEHDVLKVFYQIIRLGLVILVFSGLGYLILWRLNFLGPQVFFSDRFLAKITVILVLLAAPFSYPVIIFIYIILIFAAYFVLQFLRNRAGVKHQ